MFKIFLIFVFVVVCFADDPPKTEIKNNGLVNTGIGLFFLNFDLKDRSVLIKKIYNKVRVVVINFYFGSNF